MNFFRSLSVTVLVSLLATSPLAFAKVYKVNSEDAFNKVASKLKAGDSVVLKNGTYEDFEILLTGKGTEDKPIELRAQTSGQVVLSGQSNLRLAGEYLVVKGLVFKDGYTPTKEVISFRKDSDELAYHSRVMEVVVEEFNNPDKQETDYWVALYGKHNRFDHSALVGKRNRGVTMAVRLNTEDSQNNHHRIDHNYFGPRPTFGSNGGETVRVGTSHYSLTDSHTLIENNYFDQCNGEVEIISVKSGSNVLRGNVFFESQGTLTLRHGNNNLIENNVFIGNGVEHTGGIRVINKYQTVRNNYLEGLEGYRFGAGLTVMNGVPNSPINRYHQVEGAVIENNTLINVRQVGLAAGSDSERSAVPIDSVFRNNLIYSDSDKANIDVFDDISGLAFEGNVSGGTLSSNPGPMDYRPEMTLSKGENGLQYPTDSSLDSVGVKHGLKVLDKADAGPSWYEKKPLQAAFGSGETVSVAAGSGKLFEAIAKAKSGDVLELAPGLYEEPKIISVDKVLTIKAKQPLMSEIRFERSALFQVENGGSLKLSGLKVNGVNAPDGDGNAVIRTAKWGMYENYRLDIENSHFLDLDVNKDFSVIATGKGAFADEIALRDVVISQVSGDVIQLNREFEDRGVYNAEYVRVINTQVSDVQGALLNVYRGGTDESTFGPHVYVKDSQLSNVGQGKRNKTGASVYLHGAQVVELAGNTVENSEGFLVENTVGEPIVSIENNLFEKAPVPVVKELVFPERDAAMIRNNKQK